MSTRPREPLQGTISAIAAVVSLVLFAAAPALATSDLDIACDESAAPTLEVAETEFTTLPRIEKNEAEAELAVPTKGSRLIYRRQMYRRDI